MGVATLNDACKLAECAAAAIMANRDVNVSPAESSPDFFSNPLLTKLRGCFFVKIVLCRVTFHVHTGLVHLLKNSPQPIKDGHFHLLPFCETLETIFRDGLKRACLSVCTHECACINTFIKLMKPSSFSSSSR